MMKIQTPEKPAVNQAKYNRLPESSRKIAKEALQMMREILNKGKKKND
jgi:TRAP-type C4-dicarboxylate transport system substrate-binding protein